MVQYNDLQQEDAAWGMLEGRSIPSWKFSVETPPGSGNYVPQGIGFGYTGTLAEMPQQRQATDYTTKEPKYYKDGAPIMEIILTLQTNERNDEEDDGMRRWYLSGMARRALQDEMKRLGIKRFGLGTQVTATVDGFKPNPKGRSTMLFNVQLAPTEYVAPQQQAVEHTLAQGFTPQAGYNTPTQWAQPQQQAPVQQFMQQPVQQPVAQVQPHGQTQYPGQSPYYQAPPSFSQVAQPQPVAQFQQPVQQPVAQPQFVAPVPQPVAQAPVQAVAQAPMQVVATADHVGQVQLLMSTGGINRQTAIQAVADMHAPGDAGFRDALDRQVAPEGVAVGAGETFIA